MSNNLSNITLGFSLTSLIRINEFLAVSIQRLDLFWGASASFGGLKPPKLNASYVPDHNNYRPRPIQDVVAAENESRSQTRN